MEASWTLEGGGGARVARAVRADAITPSTFQRVTTGDRVLDDALGGGWAWGFTVVVGGPEGAGKSRLSYRWASHAHPSLVIALEMSPELTAATAEMAGAQRERLYLVDTADGWRAEAERLRVRSVVVDSITEAPRPLALLAELRAWARERNGIAWSIAHLNRKGRVRGDSRQVYLTDANIRVVAAAKGFARVSWKKCRFSPSGGATVPIAR